MTDFLILIFKNRILFVAQRWPSDNADIAVHHVHGWLIAMTESFYIHLLDPFTLETKHTLDVRDSPNRPEGT